MITEKAVRAYIRDSVMADNPLRAGELRYTPEDISEAMRTAAREFNTIPPIGVLHVDANALPDDTNIFFDGITVALLRQSLIYEASNDVEVTGGNTAVRLSATQISHLKTILIPMFEERFRRAATDVKISRNLFSAFGSVGGTL